MDYSNTIVMQVSTYKQENGIIKKKLNGISKKLE